ncbi:hypothetical protein BSKO_11706 [Bryopsis sp. KO-2023]|nr:hypothetical protein BSKO_11706 [Bryopsis sp. KO-2023]
MLWSRFSQFLLDHHWYVVRVAFPASFAFGFCYSWETGQSPLEGAKRKIVGDELTGERKFTIRLSSLEGHR